METLLAKVGRLLTSRKFYALVGALIFIGRMYSENQIDAWEATQAIVTATGIFSGAVAYEDAQQTSTR